MIGLGGRHFMAMIGTAWPICEHCKASKLWDGGRGFFCQTKGCAPAGRAKCPATHDKKQPLEKCPLCKGAGHIEELK
jgi:hypothetical protein